MDASRPAPLTLADMGELFEEAFGPSDQGFPADFLKKRGRRVQVPADHLILEVGELGQEHIDAAIAHVESGAVLGVHKMDLKRIRQNHHRLAQYLAMGMDDIRAARACNMQPNSIAQLRMTPAFQELLAHYADGVQEEFSDFVTAAKDLSMDLIDRFREILDDAPEKLTPQILLEGIKTLADRSGHAPVNRSIAISASVDMGDKIKRARERVAAAIAEGS